MSSKLFHLASPSATPATILRCSHNHNHNNSSSLLSLLRFITKPKPIFPQTLHFRRYNVSSVAFAIENTTTTTTEGLNNNNNNDNNISHPWPEWVAFVDHLKSQGYFSQASSSLSSNGGGELLYREMNTLKDPCLSFARDRYDIFSSLPKDDIQIIVKDGCPKLLRKVVNSAKRLRIYVGLDEQSVCSVCRLQSSCDRAYVVLKESDGDARIVDLMRLLMFYALDPLLMSGEVRTPAMEKSESSARRLLSMFADLSEASPGLTYVEPQTSFIKKKQVKYEDALLPEKADLQEKWVSPNVNSSKKASPADVEVKQGDWICPKCSFLNFKRNVLCLKCKAVDHKQSNARDAIMKPGDWNCLQCGCMNFANRKLCFRCSDPRPPRTLQPGEWECPKCGIVNFRRNVVCFKCGTERNKEAVAQYEEQFWRKPH